MKASYGQVQKDMCCHPNRDDQRERRQQIGLFEGPSMVEGMLMINDMCQQTTVLIPIASYPGFSSQCLSLPVLTRGMLVKLVICTMGGSVEEWYILSVAVLRRLSGPEKRCQ